jgi:hypothetical protein
MIEEMRGHFVRTAHDAECDGWLLQGFDTIRSYGKPDEGRPAYRPCHVCRPGQHAVWEAGLLLPRIDEKPEQQSKAREIYMDAEIAAGNLKRAEHVQDKIKEGRKKSRRTKESEDSWV